MYILYILFSYTVNQCEYLLYTETYTDLAKILGKLSFILNNMSKSTLHSKIHGKIRKAFRDLKDDTD